jgi:hypothetical protein
MKLFPRMLLAMLVAVQAATSAVVYVDLIGANEGFLGIGPGNPFARNFDFDQNGSTDLQFVTGTDIYGFYVTSPITTRVVGVSWFGVVPMLYDEPIGSILGPTANPRAAVYADPQRWFAITQYFQLSHGFNDNGDVMGGPWHPTADAYGEDAYLGFEFQGEGGAHYGWIRIHEFAGLGGFFREYAYEDAAGVGIRAGQIPEISSLTFITGGIVLSLLRRRRAGRS